MNFKLRIIFLFALFQLSACDSDVMPDCFKNTGAIIMYEVEVPQFTSIETGEGLEVIIKEEVERKVTVETAENFKSNISVDVIGGKLVLKNNNSCNWVRGYNVTKIYVSTPVLDKVYSASQFAVRSDGVLTFPNLELQSGLFAETASGSFELEVNSQNLIVQDNQSLYCNISGAVDNLSVNFYSGDARFEGANLIAQNISIYHRSSNDIIVNPQQQITGTIASTGNLILVNHPPIIEVGQLYTGNLQYW